MSVTYLLWTAMAVYAAVMFVLSPRAKTFGAGDYAGLLGINVFATAIVFGGFAVGTGVDWLAGEDTSTAV